MPDRFGRMRRKKDKTSHAPTTTMDTQHDASSTGSKTPPPSNEVSPSPPVRPVSKRNPFRMFHRHPGKRARETPSSSFPSPLTVASNSASQTQGLSSPMSLMVDKFADRTVKEARPPRIPAFLELTEQDIVHKFRDLVSRERNRYISSPTGPSTDSLFVRFPPRSYLRHLDRYTNIQPWYNRRVHLQVPEGHADYINASPIELPPSHRRVAVTGDSEPDRYIAMQGPLEGTSDHVWRMVVEQIDSPGVIIMLTQTHEGNSEKCYPYFPHELDDPPLEINEDDEFGDGFRATVHCAGVETPVGDAIELRKLMIRVYPPGSRLAGSGSGASILDDQEHDMGDVTSAKPHRAVDEDEDVNMKSPTGNRGDSEPPTSPASLINLAMSAAPLEQTPTKPEQGLTTVKERDDEEYKERIVYHFLYTKWPDFGVPAVDDLESFFALMRLSQEKNAGHHKPRIVHCSAGVGRSGTFIALEHVLKELEAGTLEHWDEEIQLASPLLVSEQNIEEIKTSLTRETRYVDRGSRLKTDEDLIYATVDLLRQQRRTMVQSEAQYSFIYKVLRNLWLDKYSEDEVREPAAKRLEVDPFVED